MTQKNTGIWLDHSMANLIDITESGIISKSIKSEFTHQEKEYTLSKNENLMHNKEQHQQSKFYKEICDAVKNSSGILLFGPTTAKNELFNLLNDDQHFKNIKIEVKNTDKMTDNQKQLFVKDHFLKSLK
jgi:hypothetical protein